jgi:hypothetical protein
MATMNAPTKVIQMNAPTRPAQIRVAQRSLGYWRVTIDNPPINVMGPEMGKQFQEVINALEADEHVRVVVFDSAVDDYLLNQSDCMAKLEDLTALRGGSHFLHEGGLYVSESQRRKACSAKRGPASPTRAGGFQNHVVRGCRLETVPGVPPSVRRAVVVVSPRSPALTQSGSKCPTLMPHKHSEDRVHTGRRSLNSFLSN